MSRQASLINAVIAGLFYAMVAFAIGKVLAHAVNKAKAETINVGERGAKYRDSSPAAVAANDTAVANAIDQLVRLGGGELKITGPLAISKTIEFPSTTYNGSPGYPSHFAIAGNGADSEIFDVDGGTAVRCDSSKFPGNLPGYDLRRSLRDIGVRGGGVQVIQGGKYFTMRGVRIYGVPSGNALEVRDYDGGILEANIHDCGGDGFLLDGCHHVALDLTARLCATGGTLRNSVVSGRVYCESNKGLGLVCDRVTRSQLATWLEGQGAPFQGQRRNCWGNVFTGQQQGPANNAWDDDSLSALCNRSDSLPASVGPVGEKMLDKLSMRPNGWDKSLVDATSQHIWIHQYAFEGFKNGRCIEFLRDSDALDCGGAWNAGDWMFFVCDVSCDGDTAKWYADNPGTCLRFSAMCSSGQAPTLGQNWQLTGRGGRMVTLAECKGDGAGLRPIAYVDIGRANSPKQPDRELGLDCQLQVFIVRK